jgi:hypothetical protein
MEQRQLQNAADAAALAAAANAGGTYATEANAVARTYGYKPTTSPNNDLTVTPSKVACPSGGASLDCFQVVIKKNVPLYLTQVVGFRGGANHSDGRPGVDIRAVAIASGQSSTNYCLIGLGSGDNKFNSSGGTAYNVQLAGQAANGFKQCGARTNGNISCAAYEFGYIGADSAKNCGSYTDTSSTTYTDPYSTKNFGKTIKDAIGANPCASPTALPATLTSGSYFICPGANALANTVSITGTDVIIYVYGTTLDLNNYSINTASGGTATIVFTGSCANYSGCGSLAAGIKNTGNKSQSINIIAPSPAAGSTFPGMAMIFDPRFDTPTTFTADNTSSNKLDFHTFGTLYGPYVDFVIKGGMDGTLYSGTTSEISCISIIANSIYVNGSSIKNVPGDCKAKNYDMAQASYKKQSLVQ